MEKLEFETKINAPAQKIWDIMWQPDSYAAWTKHFSPGSKIKADWQEGGTAKFLDAEEKTGMIHRISKLNAPYEVDFKVRGFVSEGRENFDSPDIAAMQDATESYRLKEENGITTLYSSVDVLPQYKDHMQNGFQKGFEEVKRLAEQ